MKDTLFVVDLDGVTFDSTERFKKATTNGKTNWDIAFDPALLSLDTLIPGAYDAIDILSTRGDIIYLTSRPESLYDASKARLAEFELDNDLICKPKSAQYVKTVKWKAEEVKKLALEYKNVVFIDDEQNNRDAVEALELPNVFCTSSLASAVRSELHLMYDKIAEERDEVSFYPDLPCVGCLTATYRGILQYNRGEWFIVARCNICQDKLDEQIEIQQAKSLMPGEDGPALML